MQNNLHSRRLAHLLKSCDFSFSRVKTNYPPHSVHPFPAKFPPQLAALFIEKLSKPGEAVLDPMMGSGTCLVECQRLGRRGYGFDVDPLSVLLARAKTHRPRLSQVRRTYGEILSNAKRLLRRRSLLKDEFQRRFGLLDQEFVRFWFPARSRTELLALVLSIEKVTTERSRLAAWFRVLLSSIIITKDVGVSLAKDLSHSRPHRSKKKDLKSPLVLFGRRFQRLLDQIRQTPSADAPVKIGTADCRTRIPLPDKSVHLVVTSPPYATAIDYLRSHKFSLVWMRHSLGKLARIRKKHIGGVRSRGATQDNLPSPLRRKLALVRKDKPRQARNLERYFCDLRMVLREIHRVLKPGRPVVVVVGPCFSNGFRLDTHRHLLRFLKETGFKICGSARREIPRNKRMLPMSANGTVRSRIERRIHYEYLVGATKPYTRTAHGGTKGP